MEIQLMCIGKTDRSIWSEALAKYQYRLKNYIKFSVIYLPNIKISKKIFIQIIIQIIFRNHIEDSVKNC